MTTKHTDTRLKNIADMIEKAMHSQALDKWESMTMDERFTTCQMLKIKAYMPDYVDFVVSTNLAFPMAWVEAELLPYLHAHQKMEIVRDV